MSKRFGISFVGFRSDLVTKPLVRNIPLIDEMIIVSTSNEKALTATKEVKEFLSMINVPCDVIQIQDAYNFFELYFTFEKIYYQYGKPVWVNVSAGPGIGIVALSMIAILHNIPLISYDLQKDAVIISEISKLKRINFYKNKYFNLIEKIGNRKITLEELSREFGTSKSSMSRRLKNLREFNIVRTVGSGKGKSKMTFELSSFGIMLLTNNSGIKK